MRGGGADGVMPIWRNLTGSAALALVAEFVRNFTALFVKLLFKFPQALKRKELRRSSVLIWSEGWQGLT